MHLPANQRHQLWPLVVFFSIFVALVGHAQPDLTLPGGGIGRLTYASRSDRQYFVEWSPDLLRWFRLPFIVRGTDGPLQSDDAIGGIGRRFYRVTESPVIAFPLFGYDFSPYLDGQNPNLRTAISRGQIEARMRLLIGQSEWVRTFSMVDGLEESGDVARQLGFKVALGAWLGKQGTPDGLLANQTNIANLIAAGQAGKADLLIVGSEVLQRGDLAAETLVAYINEVKAAVPGVPVTTADTYTMLSDVTVTNTVTSQSESIMEACDLDMVMANFYPFWEKIPVENALVNLNRAYEEMTRRSGGRPVWISETGWPSDGPAQGAAVPSHANAVLFFHQSVSWARTRNIPMFYFAAFDEAWKATTNEGPVGEHWGTSDKNGSLKPGMSAIYDSESLLPANWNDLINGPGTPEISITTVPAPGSDTHIDANNLVSGTVSHVRPFDAFVVIYIRVGGKWYIKPFSTRHLTAITSGGNWTARFVTGGADATATEIAAFVIPPTYIPPLLGFNYSSLPQDLFDSSLASAVYVR